jgi:hypothetical protein
VTEEKAKPYHFTLYDKHIDFLDQINNNNRSGALQTVLDSIINGEEQTQRRHYLDQSIHYATYGAILLFLSYLIPLEARIAAIVTGVFLFAYGIIGGVQLAVSSTKRHRRNTNH